MCRYPLAPGVTYADHGRDLLSRLTKENSLCSTKGLGFLRRNPFAIPTQRELNTGIVRVANLLDPDQTELARLTVEELIGITLGPFQVETSREYITGIQEEDVLAAQQGNYVDPVNFHQLASQVGCFSFFLSVFQILLKIHFYIHQIGLKQAHCTSLIELSGFGRSNRISRYHKVC